jgi:hypothetical protein
MAIITSEPHAGLSALDLAPTAVQEFVIRRGLSSDLREAVALAGKVFDVSGAITLSVEEDPDTGESWVEMGVAARGSVDTVMKSHENYTERLLSLPTAPSRQIRLFLHIARD